MQDAHNKLTRMVRDAVARWETYEDRGITPRVYDGRGELDGANGKSCALGDIAHYAGMETWCDVRRMFASCQGEDEAWYFTEDISVSDPGQLLYRINDLHRRWPTKEARRWLAWEDARVALERSVGTSQGMVFA